MGLNSSRMKGLLFELPKTIHKYCNLPLSLPPVENEESEEEDFDDSQSEGMKIIVSSNLFDMRTT